MQRNLYLIGFMGSGKSHVGRKLAKYLQLPLIDLDTFIVEREGASINAIFSQKGPAYFRILERHALHQTALNAVHIIATGGGTPCFFDNMQWMNQQGTTIYLDTPSSILAQRLWKGKDKRPLIRSLSKAELPNYINKKLAERSSFYERAEVHFKVHSPEQDVAGDLYRQLNYIVGH